MDHIMIDLEAMDTEPTAAIVSLAAVEFDPQSNALGRRFYQRVSLDSSQRQGGTLGADTVQWWLRQDAAPRSEIINAGASISHALNELCCFILRIAPIDDVQIWAKGTDYDLPILYSALRRAGLTPPWKFYNVNDVRTLQRTAACLGMDYRQAVPFVGEPHHALNDAAHQARTVNYIWQQLGAAREAAL